MIVADRRNPTAGAFERELSTRMPEGLPADVIVVIGGDGFMLSTVAEHGFNKTYLGLNAGRVGFLMNDLKGWKPLVAQLRKREWSARLFPTLAATLHLEDGSVRVDTAINDIYLERSTGQTAHLTVSIDGQEVVDRLVADGIIVSTALGSTAYTYSAGGAACHPTLRTMSVTPICPHSPRLAPLVLPPDSTVHIDVLNRDRRPVRAVADGRAHDQVTAVEVSLGTEQLRIAHLPGHDFTTQMVTKILLP